MRRNKATWWGLLCLAVFLIYLRASRRRRRKRIRALERALFPELFAHELVRVPHYGHYVPRGHAPVNPFRWPDIPSSSEFQRLVQRAQFDYDAYRRRQPNTLEYELKRRHQIFQQTSEQRRRSERAGDLHRPGGHGA